ncbi:hypothetical protein L227DRAFT_84807 [Lentinus tigrinus ALCF2SS1-6]|uniref:Uncharacterized protein n=1 Tax=Lentinus tigrinus ALCF2SS1-6 TaxID=1328759 RepID=A0A5C2SAF2_9APHY|nr:hypothetical protein L227DRAFT_84807 [Lentinus tigrinus ALCF2SS1-6]
MLGPLHLIQAIARSGPALCMVSVPLLGSGALLTTYQTRWHHIGMHFTRSSIAGNETWLLSQEVELVAPHPLARYSILSTAVWHNSSAVSNPPVRVPA